MLQKQLTIIIQFFKRALESRRFYNKENKNTNASKHHEKKTNNGLNKRIPILTDSK